MSTWSLVTFHVGSGPDRAGIARLDGSIVVPAVLDGFAGLIAAVQEWPEVSSALRTVDPDRLDPVEGAVTGLSLRYPRKVICAGANYTDHIAEMGGDPAPDGWRPFFFLVPPTTALIGSGDAIEIAPDEAALVDWEAEIAIVIGRRATRIGRDEAMAHVAGFACLSDITARAALHRQVALAPPFQWDWAEAKGLDTFTPLGPVTPAWLVSDPANLNVRCWVNGILKQDGNTRDFICDMPELISAASHLCTLEPGDVIATGTPAGVGSARGEHLVAGDVVRVEIDGLAALENPIRLCPHHTRHAPTEALEESRT